MEHDPTLVLAARAGDAAAFTRLHDRYAPWVHAILLARVPRREVEDLVQEVVLTAWKKLPSLRDPAAFPGWLARIARNRAVDFHRGADRRRTEALPDEVAGCSGPEANAAASEALAAIRGLPEAYRETLILRLVEGWTGPEIAARTGRTPGSVRVNLHRGMTLLREALGCERS